MTAYLTRDQLAEYVGREVEITSDFGTRRPFRAILLGLSDSDIFPVGYTCERGVPCTRDLSRVTAIREATKGES